MFAKDSWVLKMPALWMNTSTFPRLSLLSRSGKDVIEMSASKSSSRRAGDVLDEYFEVSWEIAFWPFSMFLEVMIRL